MSIGENNIMCNSTKISISVLMGVVGVFATASVRAQNLQFTLNPSTQSYTTAQTAIWNATFVNNTASTITFTAINIQNTPPEMITDYDLYLTNIDATTLGVGASVTANIFTSTAPSIVPGTYDGKVLVSYRITGNPTDSTEEALFVSIITGAAIPEPSSIALLSLGTVAFVRRRQYQKK
jgi:hypothetical protein